MNTRLFQTDGDKQDGNRAQVEAQVEAQRRHSLACKPLNHRPESMSRVSAGQTPPRYWGRGPHVRGVAGYRSRLAGASKEKIKKADAVLDAMAAQLLDLGALLPAALLLGGNDD